MLNYYKDHSNYINKNQLVNKESGAKSVLGESLCIQYNIVYTTGGLGGRWKTPARVKTITLGS